MSNKTLPIIIGAGLVGAAYLSAKAYNATTAVKKLKVIGFKIKKFNADPFNMFMDVELNIENPSSSNIPLEYYTGQIIYQDAPLTNFSFNGNGKNYIIAARTVTPLVFQVRFGLAIIPQIVSIIKKISQGVKLNTVFTVKSSLYAGGIDLPVNFTYDLKPGVMAGIGKIRFGKLFRKINPLANAFSRLKKRKKNMVQQMTANRANRVKSFVAPQVKARIILNRLSRMNPDQRAAYIQKAALHIQQLQQRGLLPDTGVLQTAANLVTLNRPAQSQGLPMVPPQGAQAYGAPANV